MRVTKLIRDIELTSSRIVFDLVRMDSWSSDDLYAVLGVPLLEEVGHDYQSPSNPRYGVDCALYSNLSPKLVAPKISVLLADSSDYVNSAPKGQFWLSPRANAFFAPEVLFRLQYGPEADLWGLGCALYEARSGKIPFSLNNQNEPAEVVVAIVHTLGKLPKTWPETGFNEYGQVDCGGSHGKALMRNKIIS